MKSDEAFICQWCGAEVTFNKKCPMCGCAGSIEHLPIERRHMHRLMRIQQCIGTAEEESGGNRRLEDL